MAKSVRAFPYYRQLPDEEFKKLENEGANCCDSQLHERTTRNTEDDTFLGGYKGAP